MIFENYYRSSDFRQILQRLVEAKKATNPRYNFSTLAADLRVQKTFLSKVINGKGLLSSDQVFLLAEVFALSHEEQEYFLLLLEIERTGLASRKKVLLRKLASIQSAHRKPDKVLKTDMVQASMDSPATKYYIDPYVTLMHMHLMLPALGGDPEQIGKKLRLSPAYQKKLIDILLELKLIETIGSGNRYRVIKSNLYLAPDSPLTPAYCALFRMISAEQVMKLSTDHRCAYSLTIAADEKTRAHIHEEFLSFLRNLEKTIQAAPSEEVYQLNFDLFAWG